MKKPIKKKKKITLEGLAVIVQKGFAAVDARFDAVDARFESIDKKFNAIDARFEAIENKLSGLERRIMFLEDKITEHTKELRRLRVLIEKYCAEQETDREKILWLEKRVEKLEEKAGLKQ